MRHIAFPFLTLEDTRVVATAWKLVDDRRGPEALEDFIEGWDYARDLQLERTITLDRAIGSDALGMEIDGAQIAVFVRVGTGPGSMPRRLSIAHRERLKPGQPVEIRPLVVGSQLSQRLLLETTIVLASPGAATSRFAPKLPGAILWRDRLDVALEGQAPRFPMEIVSFNERFAGRPESSAPWLLHWLPGQLNRDFGGSVRLYLNHDRADFIERFRSADPLTLQVTLADVINQILSYAIAQEDLAEQLADVDATSVAGHIASWLELAFPGQSVSSVRSLHDTAPGRFHAAILSMADPQVLGGAE